MGGKGTRPRSSTGVLPLMAGEVQLDGLGVLAEVVHAEHDRAVQLAHEGEDGGVLRGQDLEGARAEDGVVTAHLEHALDPEEQ